MADNEQNDDVNVEHFELGVTNMMTWSSGICSCMSSCMCCLLIIGIFIRMIMR